MVILSLNKQRSTVLAELPSRPKQKLSTQKAAPPLPKQKKQKTTRRTKLPPPPTSLDVRAFTTKNLQQLSRTNKTA